MFPNGITVNKVRQTYKDGADAGFTLIETMITAALMLILVIALMNSVFVMDQSSRRLGDYSAALAYAQGELEAVKTNRYNPPAAPFTAGATNLTNTVSLILNKAGDSNLLNGTNVVTIEPVAAGHLITVRGTYRSYGAPIIVQLQGVVNKFSGGQQ